MKIGLCGTSNISKTYLKCIRKLGHEIDIVFGNDLQRLKNFSKIHNISNITTNINDLIVDKEIKSYIIANDPSKHLDIAEPLVISGKNVLIEKPLDVSVNKIESFYKLTKNKNNIIHTVNQNRFDPFYFKIKKKLETIIDTNKNTKHASLRMFFYRNDQYFNSSNQWKKNFSCPLINQGIHFLDLMLWFFGDFLEVRSLTQKDNTHLKLDDNIVGSVKFKNNILLNIFASTSIERNEVDFEFFFNNQTIKFKKKYSSSRIKNILSLSRSPFNLFKDQCNLFIKSIENQDVKKNNIMDAYNVVKLEKKLNY